MDVMSNNKQTAIEWLINEIDMQYPEINVRCKEWMVEKAKQMDKEQKMDAYEWGRADEKNLQEDIVAPEYNNAEEFYQGEYGK